MRVTIAKINNEIIIVEDVYEIREYSTYIYIHSKTRNDNLKIRKDELVTMTIVEEL